MVSFRPWWGWGGPLGGYGYGLLMVWLCSQSPPHLNSSSPLSQMPNLRFREALKVKDGKKTLGTLSHVREGSCKVRDKGGERASVSASSQSWGSLPGAASSTPPPQVCRWGKDGMTKEWGHWGERGMEGPRNRVARLSQPFHRGRGPRTSFLGLE